MFTRLTKAERLFTHGQRLAAQQCFSEALTAFAQAATQQPRHAGILVHWALALAEAGNVAQAVDIMQQAVALRPTNPVPPMFLSQIFFDAAEYLAAQEWCTRALQLSPQNLHALALQALLDLALGQIPQGYQRLQQPPPQPVTGLERGLLRLERMRLPSVLQLSNTALQSRLLLWVETWLGQQPVPHRTLSQQLVETTAVDTPPASLLLLDRLCTRAVMGLTRGYLRLRYAGQPAARARRMLQTAADEAYYLGDAATAHTYYTQLLQQAPELSAVQERCCEVAYEQGDFPQALHMLQQLLAQQAVADGPSAWEACLLGELLYQVGQYQNAVTSLTRAASLGLRDYKLFYYLGLGHLRAAAPQQARWHFARAVQELNPGLDGFRLEEMYRVYQAATTAAPAPQRMPEHARH